MKKHPNFHGFFLIEALLALSLLAITLPNIHLIHHRIQTKITKLFSKMRDKQTIIMIKDLIRQDLSQLTHVQTLTTQEITFKTHNQKQLHYHLHNTQLKRKTNGKHTQILNKKTPLLSLEISSPTPHLLSLKLSSKTNTYEITHHIR